MKMTAVVPAAGQGTRLYPQTHTKPKPMIRVAGKPILGHILDNLAETRIEEVVIVVGVMRDVVEEYVTREYGDTLAISFVEQEQTEGLGHSIYQARQLAAGDSLFIALGDMLFERSYDDFLTAHERDGGPDGSIGVKEVENPSNYGVVAVEDGRITDLEEKPEHPESNLAISGVYVIEDSESLFDALEFLITNGIRGADDEFQLTDALQRMVTQGARLGTFKVSEWYDCGRPETLLEANRVLLDRREERSEGQDISTDATLEESSIVPPVDIGSEVTIRRSVIGPYVSIDDGAEIEDARVQDAIIGKGSLLETVNLTNSLIGDDSSVSGTPNELNVGDSSEVQL